MRNFRRTRTPLATSGRFRRPNRPETPRGAGVFPGRRSRRRTIPAENRTEVQTHGEIGAHFLRNRPEVAGGATAGKAAATVAPARAQPKASRGTPAGEAAAADEHAGMLIGSICAYSQTNACTGCTANHRAKALMENGEPPVRTRLAHLAQRAPLADAHARCPCPMPGNALCARPTCRAWRRRRWQTSQTSGPKAFATIIGQRIEIAARGFTEAIPSTASFSQADLSSSLVTGRRTVSKSPRSNPAICHVRIQPGANSVNIRRFCDFIQMGVRAKRLVVLKRRG